MGWSTLLALALLALYGLFLLWYGGRGRPLSQAEIEAFMVEFADVFQNPQQQQLADELRALLAKDDGREFVMQNLVRYRAKALYPEGSPFGDDPREADRRYGRAIIGPLLRVGSLPIFIARRVGSFIEPIEGAPHWHYVAMVRYRSRRDFLRFARMIERGHIVVHKWAAIETTHVFPVQPLVSLIFVRGAVAAVLLLAWLALR